jgi:fused signal recognition particle receptor
LSDEQPVSKTRKPGFFSRLFIAKDIEVSTEELISEESVVVEEVEAPVEAVVADLSELEDQPLAIEEDETAGPEGFDAGPALEDVPAPKKRGIISRWFGKKEAEPEGEEVTEPVAEELEAAPVEAEEEVAAVVQEEPVAPKKSWFQRLRERLRMGSGSFIGAIRKAIGLSGRLDADTIEKLEEILVASDVSMATTMKIIDRMQQRADKEKIEGADAIMDLFKETVREVFIGTAQTFAPQPPADGPYVVTVVGVNGVGKTTTIGKMAKRCRDAGLSVMLVAGDTFRAAAIEQLEIWAKRSGSEFMSSKAGADPTGLIFDALKAAKSRGIDVVFIDTAGRLHTKTSLMEELGKVGRVCDKVIKGTPHETLLVLDATTGQNAVNQVQVFSKAANITGLVMTKLDGTAKGGILITIRDQFRIPVSLIGVGEGVDDLRDFDPEQFTAALFEEDAAEASSAS